jgi:uracil-DNA glycosylase
LGQAGIDPGDVILWNAVPFHPARADDPLRNRRPSADELVVGAGWLARFLALMQPGPVVAVGRTAGQALPAGTRIVRHPANGGSRQLQIDLAGLASELGYAREPRDGVNGIEQRAEEG